MTLPLFVYGTLRSDGPNAGLLGARRREKATVRGLLYALPQGYPALAKGDGEVEGELVYDVDETVLTVLDVVEGVDGELYTREVAEARMGLEPVRCWLYRMVAPLDRGGRLIRSGRWRVRRRG
jgi:gamma-glutamylcyclotransferase (GGCT)/AIG2-like uncharacterized protein YtfP